MNAKNSLTVSLFIVTVVNSCPFRLIGFSIIIVLKIFISLDISEFQTLVGGFISVVESLASQVENEKLKVWSKAEHILAGNKYQYCPRLSEHAIISNQ